jgi:branched-chain amino acid transport system permease protein
MEFFTISLLNGLSYGLLLFMLSSGLTLIFSMMGVLNFAHASFYMLGAYFAYATSQVVGYWPALFAAPLMVAVLGALFERYCLRRVHKFGHVAELLITFGLSFIILEVVQLIWGTSSVDYRVPPSLSGPLFTLYGTQFPVYRGFMMLVAILMLIGIWLLLTRTRIGLVIQAALTHPETVEVLGHNVPRVFMLVFGGGAALAGLAVVVVVGGMGSLSGAFVASLLIGVIQTYAVGVDSSVVGAASTVGLQITPETFGYTLWKLKVSQIAPILPYMFLVLVLIFRPKGLLGTREG